MRKFRDFVLSTGNRITSWLNLKVGMHGLLVRCILLGRFNVVEVLYIRMC